MQGEQVGQLWPLLFEPYGMELTFAHRTFAWDSGAPSWHVPAGSLRDSRLQSTAHEDLVPAV